MATEMMMIVPVTICSTNVLQPIIEQPELIVVMIQAPSREPSTDP